MTDIASTKAKILVVDGEPIIHSGIRSILDSAGYETVCVDGLDHAIAAAAAQRFDLALVNLTPGADSARLLKVITESRPYMGTVVFTGYAALESVITAFKMGALDYLPKPFSADELLESVGDALKKVEQRRKEEDLARLYIEAERATTGSLDLRELLHLLCGEVIKLLNVKGSAVLILKREDDTLEPAAACGLSEEFRRKGPLSREKSISRMVHSDNPSVVFERDFDQELQYPAEARKENLRSMVSVPLKLNDSILGFLRLYSEEERVYDEKEMALLLKFAEYGSRALDHAMLYEKIRSDIAEMKGILA
jgi:ActR/RegA family two-component response regulator